jgi:two-component system chemotaxis response regulator CheY
MKSLIVEDDFVSRALIQGYLLKFGTCHIAANGKEGVEAVVAALESGNPYDFIALDIMMPELDGHKTLAQIRTAEESHGRSGELGARVVITTALKDQNSIMEALKSEVDAYMIKPIVRKAFLEKLEEIGLINNL